MHQLEPMTWEAVLASFRNIWGYANFRYPQGEIVQSLLSGRDALVVMPTGGGKSICFQLPALLQSGLTLVVSPLVALMENQVQELQQRLGDRAWTVGLLHNQMPKQLRVTTLNRLERGQLRLLYLSPETLLSEPVWTRLLRPAVQIRGMILDEAHCLVQWGDTFRPAYRRLGAVREALLAAKPTGSRMAIAAFTATADPIAQQTIRDVLQLQQPAIYRLNPHRANLALRVQTVWSPRARRQKLVHLINAHPHETGLVYVRTRRDAEALADWLTTQGMRTAAYHAGLSPQHRRQLETEWLDGRLSFVICTSAFGMGINKSNVRWVIHFQTPALLSEYVQEVGRAGRDGQFAEAIALVSERTGWLDPEDKQRWHFFEAKQFAQQRAARLLLRRLPPRGNVNDITKQFTDGAIALALLHRDHQLRWLDPFHYELLPSTATPAIATNPSRQMHQFLYGRDCRWRFLLNAFGFAAEAKEMRCGLCDRCQTNRKH